MLRPAILLCLVAVSLQACAAGYFTNPNPAASIIANCIRCPFPCIECGNASLTSCTKYADGYTVNGSSYCSLGGARTFLNPKNNLCETNCLQGCNTCSEGDYSYCFTCSTGYVLQGNSCKSVILYNAVLIGLISFLAVIKVFELLYQFYKYRQAKKAEKAKDAPHWSNEQPQNRPIIHISNEPINRSKGEQGERLIEPTYGTGQE